MKDQGVIDYLTKRDYKINLRDIGYQTSMDRFLQHIDSHMENGDNFLPNVGTLGFQKGECHCSKFML